MASRCGPSGSFATRSRSSRGYLHSLCGKPGDMRWVLSGVHAYVRALGRDERGWLHHHPIESRSVANLNGLNQHRARRLTRLRFSTFEQCIERLVSMTKKFEKLSGLDEVGAIGGIGAQIRR
eukprot:3545577-Pleurochrysis_carterae.AAC.3